MIFRAQKTAAVSRLDRQEWPELEAEAAWSTGAGRDSRLPGTQDMGLPGALGDWGIWRGGVRKGGVGRGGVGWGGERWGGIR